MIDGHCHLDKRLGGLEPALESLRSEAWEAGVKGVILLNLPELAFENSAVLESAQRYDKFFRVFPGINPKRKKDHRLLNDYKKAGAKGVKLHPRLHNYSVECGECIDLLRQAGELKLPVLIDCWPDGKNIALGNLPESFAKIAENVIDTRIAIGHAGGHHILDAMMVSKYYGNIFLDLSFTLLYYRNSQLNKDVEYILNSMKFEKVFWGTDYPDRPYKDTMRLSLQEFDNMSIPKEKRLLLLSANALSFLGENFEKGR